MQLMQSNKKSLVSYNNESSLQCACSVFCAVYCGGISRVLFSRCCSKKSYLVCWWLFGLVGNVVGRINEVSQHRARLVLGWVTVN